jgi:hypothetical protein
MRLIILIIFILASLVLNICLLMPLVNRGMSWEEAGLGLIPSAFLALVSFVLLLTGVGAKPASSSRALRLWGAALVWSLLIGGIVTYVTATNYQSNLSLAQAERSNVSGRNSASLYQTYARYDQVGMMYGWAVLGFAGVAFLGLIGSVILKKKTPN